MAWRRGVHPMGLPWSRRTWTQLAAAVVVGYAATGSVARVGADDDITLYLNDRSFSFPVQVVSQDPDQIDEIRLYASTDFGKSWRVVATGTVDQEAFKFRAPADGEYWFAVAKVNRDGSMVPTESELYAKGPQRKVVIDTKRPQVTVEKLPEVDGKLGVSYRITEEKPDLSRLKVEIRGGSIASWQALRAPKAIAGEVEWDAEPGAVYDVRVSVADKAGNTAAKPLTVAAMDASPRSRTPSGEESDAVAMTTPGKPSGRIIPTAGDAEGVPADGSTTPALNARSAGFRMPTPPAKLPLESVPALSATATTDPAMMATLRGDDGAVPPPRPLSPIVRQEARSAAHATTSKTQPRVDREVERAAALMEPIDRNQYLLATQSQPIASSTPVETIKQVSAQKPVDDDNVPTGSAARKDTAAAAENPDKGPEPIRVPLVNSNAFQLDYALKGVGSGGVEKVELYITTDNGQNWSVAGLDADNTPPFDVKLPGEGRYGIKIVVTNRKGLTNAPRKGEPPQMQVEVDLTDPTVELYQVEPDPKSPHDTVVVTWTAKDKHLAPNPVTLHFSESPEGPWTQIADRLPAEGGYRWKLPTNYACQVYLSATAHDLVDRVARAVTPEPVTIDLSQPEATPIRIIGSLPAETIRK